MEFFFVAEETANNYVALIPSTGIDTTIDPVGFPNMVSYRQKKYNLYSPHGYFLSEETQLKQITKGLMVQCIGGTVPDTWISLFVRVKQYGKDEFDEFEKANGLHYVTDKTVTHVQYAVSLNTMDGHKTPTFSDVKIIPGEGIEPEELTEKSAVLFIGCGISQKIHYEHGIKNEKKDYLYRANYYAVIASTETITYEH